MSNIEDAPVGHYALTPHLEPQDTDFDDHPWFGESPNEVADEGARARLTESILAYYGTGGETSSGKARRELLDAWLEDGVVTIRSHWYHCSSCAGDYDNVDYARFDLGLLESPDYRERLIAIAAEERRVRQGLDARHDAWKEAMSERGEILLMRRLMEKYPAYVSVETPLPEPGEAPRQPARNVRSLLTYARDDPRP